MQYWLKRQGPNTVHSLNNRGLSHRFKGVGIESELRGVFHSQAEYPGRERRIVKEGFTY